MLVVIFFFVFLVRYLKQTKKQISLINLRSRCIKENKILFEACSLIFDVSGEPLVFRYKYLEEYKLATRDHLLI
jgi:hypothetical protein